MKKNILRIIIWSITLFILVISGIIYYLSDLNRIKSFFERELKSQLKCSIYFGDLNWDLYNFNIGVSSSTFTIIDKNGKLVLETGPARLVWNLGKIFTGNIYHFKSIEASDLFADVILFSNKTINLIEMFPKGPVPEIDNLLLTNSFIAFTDEINLDGRTIKYKELNIKWTKKSLSKRRVIDVTTKIGTPKNISFLRLKGFYTESKKFNWGRDEIDLSLIANKVKLGHFQAYLKNMPQIKKLKGEFTGTLNLKKEKKTKFIVFRSKSVLDRFKLDIQGEKEFQSIQLPMTRFSLSGIIDKNKIKIKSVRSTFDELKYSLSGDVYNWSSALPEVDLRFKTNNFNFKSIKERLPMVLLPPSTRQRIEPINDDGFVKLDINIKGPYLAPKYFGTIFLDNFNLTSESGFLEFIHGLKAKLILNDHLLNIDYINIPIGDSKLEIKGIVDNKKIINDFNIKAEKININTLQKVISELDQNIALILAQTDTFGNINLDLNVKTENTKPPIIKGLVDFSDAGAWVLGDEFLEVKNIFGKFSLDGDYLVFNNVNGLINDRKFSIDGNLSLKENELFKIHFQAEHLKILNFLFSLVKSKIPSDLIPDKITGEFSDLDLSAEGSFVAPVLNGMVLINKVSFKVPNKNIDVNEINGLIELDKEKITVNNLTGGLNNSNQFTSNISISNYISMTPYVLGNADINLDIGPVLKIFAPEVLMTIEINGTIPTKVNFDYKEPYANLQFNSLFEEKLIFNIQPYFSKPDTHAYTVSCDVGVDTKKLDLNLKKLDISSTDLSFNTKGTITNLALGEPEFMIDFYTDMNTKMYMLLKPFPQLQQIRVFGDVDLNGMLYGTPSMFDFTSHAVFAMTMIQPTNKPDKRIGAENGVVDVHFTGKTGELSADFNTIQFESFMGQEAKLLVNYIEPTVYLKELNLDLTPGMIFIEGDYNSKNGEINLVSNGNEIMLSELGEFILLNPNNLSGNTNFNLMLNAKGLNQKELLESANGDLSFSVNKGYIGEIKILHKGLQAASIFKQGIFGFNLRNLLSFAFNYKDGSFDKINGKLKINSGILKIRNINYRAPSLLLNLYGSINLLKLFSDIKLYGYLPDRKETMIINGDEFIVEGGPSTSNDAISFVPGFLKKKRLIIPFISTTPPKHFKVEIKGDLNNQKKLARRALRSFKWIRGKRLEKDKKYFPKVKE